MSWQGFPGRRRRWIMAEGNCWKIRAGAGALSTNLPQICSIPRARARLGFLSSLWKCVAVHRAAPLLQQHCRAQLCSRHPKGMVCDGLLWDHPALPVRCCFSCYPVQLQPGAAALACRGAQGLGGECRCPAQSFIWTPPQASLAPIPGTHSGRAEMLLLGSAAFARALMAAPKAKP